MFPTARSFVRRPSLAWTAALLALAGSASAQSWTEISTPVVVRKMITDPVDADHLLVTDINEADYYETFDGGVAWTPFVGPTLPAGVLRSQLSIDQGGHVVFSVCRFPGASAVAGPLCFLRNAGAWQPMGPDVLPQIFPLCGTPLVRGRIDPQRLAFSGVEWDGLSETISTFLSSDNGATWTSFSQGTRPFEIFEGTGEPYLMGAQSSALPLFATTVRRSVGFTSPTQYVYGGIDLQFDVTPRFPNELWAQLDESGSGSGIFTFLRSSDAGASWTVLTPVSSSDFLGAIELHPTRPGFAVARTALNGLVSTEDGGQTFVPMGPNYTPHGFVEAGRVLYATENVPGGFRIFRTELFPSVGIQECSAEINGSGAAASIEAVGSSSLNLNGLALQASDVAQDAFGYFLCSQQAGFVTQPGGSFGNLCLSGSIGRYVPLLQNSGGYGQLFGEIDLTSFPSPTGSVAGQVGQTWRFQAWFRDSLGGVAGSNFSNAVAVTLTP